MLTRRPSIEVRIEASEWSQRLRGQALIAKEGMTEEGNFCSAGFEGCEEMEFLAQETRRFLNSRSWCLGVDRVYFDRGFHRLCVFYAELRTARAAPNDAWVVIGDAPPAVLPTSTCRNGVEALSDMCPS